MTIRIVLADDHVVVRQGLRALLERQGFEVVGEASDGREAIRLCQALHPDTVVLDLSMPLLNGIDAAYEITRAKMGAKLVLLTMHTEGQFVAESIRAGVKAYVLKTNACEELVQAIRSVCRGEMYLTPSISAIIVEAFLAKGKAPATTITGRERQVLQLIAEGKTTKEVASILGISIRTAESHRSNLMERLNIHEAAGLVRYAVRNGLIDS
jgi:DNA-binding NarL/FixJ family response regulator